MTTSTPDKLDEVAEVAEEAKLPEGELDEKCTHDDIQKIYRSVPYTNQLASLLKLSRAQITGLESDIKDAQERQLKLLQKWKEFYSYKAKRRVLVGALLAMGDAETALEVCKLLRPPGRCYTPPPPPEEDEPVNTGSEAEYQQNSPRTEIPRQEVANQQRGQPSSVQQGGGRDERVVGGRHPNSIEGGQPSGMTVQGGGGGGQDAPGNNARVVDDNTGEVTGTSAVEGDDDEGESDGIVGDAVRAVKKIVTPQSNQPVAPPVSGDRPPPYKMSSNPRGLGIIINNKEFHSRSKLSDREGTDCDADKLESLFKFLGFTPKRYDNKKASQMTRIMEETADEYEEMQDKYDCLMVAILTHGGDNGVLWGVDGHNVRLDALTRYVDGNFCEALKGKPKVFIMQACRGGKKDTVQNFDSHEQPDSNPESDAELVARIEENYKAQLPSQRDFLLGFSTCPGYLSWRTPDTGSWYISAFVEKVREYAPKNEVHLVDILTEVNNKMTTEIGYVPEKQPTVMHKQVPSTVTRLAKPLFFNIHNLTDTKEKV